MPRAGLSGEVVVAEAARLVDEVGPDALTLAALAKRFEVALPSLYKHVRGLDDLHGRLAVTAARELGAALRKAATGRAGEDAVRRMATAYRGYAARHPGRYSYLLTPRPDDPDHRAAADEILDVLFEVLAGYGITGTDLVDAARFVRSVLHGFVSLEAGDGFGLPESVDHSFDRTVGSVHAALAGWAQAS